MLQGDPMFGLASEYDAEFAEANNGLKASHLAASASATSYSLAVAMQDAMKRCIITGTDLTAGTCLRVHAFAHVCVCVYACSCMFLCLCVCVRVSK